MARTRLHRSTLLERIVEQRTGEVLVASVGVAVEKVAEEIAKEALADETFRRTIRELVQRRSRELLDELLGDGAARKR
jgi:hydrogenase maturation factor